MTRTITLADEDAAGLLAFAKEKSGIFGRGPWSRIAAALEAQAVAGWQPIETPPKDGTEVLMFSPDQGMAVWSVPSPFWPDVTHWMPLPAPPVTP
jgi:hypothetical protein